MPTEQGAHVQDELQGMKTYTVEPGYNDIGLYYNSYITSYILWY
jgi:hypothetical protein